jgi:hypothetical protein
VVVVGGVATIGGSVVVVEGATGALGVGVSVELITAGDGVVVVGLITIVDLLKVDGSVVVVEFVVLELVTLMG